LDALRVEVALGSEGPVEFGREADDRADDDLEAEQGEDRYVPERLVQPGELKLLEKTAELAVPSQIFLAAPALGDESAQDRGGDQDDQKDNRHLDRSEEFFQGSEHTFLRFLKAINNIGIVNFFQ